MTEKQIKIIKELSEDLLRKLLIEGTVRVEEDSKNQVINIQIESEDSGMLIGYHGETLEAFQLILSLMVYKKLESWSRLVVNVGNYREERYEHLRKLALNIAQKVKFSQEAQSLTNLSSSERRVIHLELADNPDVITESEGEGDERRLVVKPKKR